jgi:putative membrane protein
MMGWNWDDGAWLGMGIGMLVWLVFAVVIVWLVVRALTALDRRGSDGRNQAAPDEILRERFARGEIDAEEYERRLTILHGR